VIRLFLDAAARAELHQKAVLEIDHFATHALDQIANNAIVRLFTNHTQRLEIIRCIESHKNWASSPQSEDGQTHLRDVKKCIAPVYHRITENVTFMTNAEKLYKSLKRVKRLHSRWKVIPSQSEGAELFRLGDHLQKVESRFNDSLVKNVNTPRWDFVPVRPKAFLDKQTEVTHHLSLVKSKLIAPKTPQKLSEDGNSNPDGGEWRSFSELEVFSSLGMDMGLDDEDPDSA
jgi:hypothetical protein